MQLLVGRSNLFVVGCKIMNGDFQDRAKRGARNPFGGRQCGRTVRRNFRKCTSNGSTFCNPPKIFGRY